MPDFFKLLDGSGRKPRGSQQRVLEELTKEWEKHQVFALVAPTGSGKSFLARTIQLACNASYITADNALLRQYSTDYRANYFWGADNYSSRDRYDDAKYLTLDPENLVAYNPVSFRNASRQKGFNSPSVVVMDEGDASLSLLSEYTATVVTLTLKEYRKNLSSPEVAAQLLLMKAAAKKADAQESLINRKLMQAARQDAQADRLVDIAEMLKLEGERFAIWTTEEQKAFGIKRYLHIKPLSTPKEFAKSYFRDAKIILMSATLMPSDVRELTGGVPYHHIEVESPIPPERRRIYSMPTEAALSYPTPHKELAEHLDKLLDDFKDIRPAMVHLPYADAFKVAQLMRTPVLTHDKDTKKEVLAEWLKNGGVLIGSGMTTGLDLKDDLCRLNIVGKVLYPSIASEFWKKKLALPGGKQAYALSALRSLVQALGRSTRSEKDWSVSILLDKRWISLYRAVKDEVPTFLKEAIVWQTVTPDQILADVEALK